MWLRMRDFLTLRVKDADNRLTFTDGKGTAPSLYVKAEATHAGIVNGNARFYRPDRMQDGAHTWVPKGRPSRPVLLNHKKDGACVGRVVGQRYVDESYKYVGDGVKGLTFYDSSTKKLNLFKSVDWVVDHLIARPDYKGLGYIELDLNVTEPEAIDKVNREEFLTVSVGFGTDAAICSICHTDWATDDKCDHELMQSYDGKRMFLITGNFRYSECSFVNFPADPWGMVTSKESVKQVSDSVANRVFFMGLSFDRQKAIVSQAGVEMKDSIDFLGSDIQPDTESEEDLPMLIDVDAVSKEIKDAALTRERALALRTELDAATDQKGIKRLLTSLIAKIRNNGWVEDAVPTKEQVEAKIESLPTVLATLATDEEKDNYQRQLETEAAAFGLTIEKEKPADAAPAETPAEAPAETDAAPAPVELDPRIREVFDAAVEAADATEKKYPNKDKVLKGIEATIALHGACNDDERQMLRSALSACLEVFSAESWLNYMKSRIESAGADMVVAKSEVDELHGAIEKFEADLKAKDESNRALLAGNQVLIQDQKQLLARVLVTGAVLLGEKGFTGLSDEQIQEEITSRSKRRLVSLQDGLEDLLKKLPGFEGQASAVKPTEAVREVSDNARVEEPAPTDAEASEGSDTAPVPPRYLNPKEARRLSIQTRYEFRKKQLTPKE